VRTALLWSVTKHFPPGTGAGLHSSNEPVNSRIDCMSHDDSTINTVIRYYYYYYYIIEQHSNHTITCPFNNAFLALKLRPMGHGGRPIDMSILLLCKDRQTEPWKDRLCRITHRVETAVISKRWRHQLYMGHMGHVPLRLSARLSIRLFPVLLQVQVS